MAYIYKITNDINNKVYIGKTYFTIEKRFEEHCRDCIKRKNEHRPLYSAMRKYGIEHFSIELIEETSVPDEREKFWIEQYNSFKNGYNATLGGDGKAYVDIELIYALWKEGKRINQIQEITGYSEKTITSHLNNYGVTFLDRRRRATGKPVAKVDKNTNEIIEVFPSISAAAESINKSHRHIGEACNGKRKTAYGYKWKFLNK